MYNITICTEYICIHLYNSNIDILYMSDNIQTVIERRQRLQSNLNFNPCNDNIHVKIRIKDINVIMAGDQSIQPLYLSS